MVLWHLQNEDNTFLLAQDAYVVISSLIEQIQSISTTIQSYSIQNATAPEPDRKISNLLVGLSDAQAIAAELLPLLSDLQSWARSFWITAPVDRRVAEMEEKESVEIWREYNGSTVFPESLQSLIRAFRDRCAEIISSLFGDFTSALRSECEEIDHEKELFRRSMGLKLSNSFSPALYCEVLSSSTAFFLSSRFPHTHYQNFNENFRRTLRYSRARLLVEPRSRFVVNNMESVVAAKMLSESTSGVVISGTRYLRAATGDIIPIKWEMVGVDNDVWVIGQDIRLLKDQLHMLEPPDQLLSKWLFSLRNAAFQEQATSILSDVISLGQKLPPLSQSKLAGIIDQLNTLVYTAKTSVHSLSSVDVETFHMSLKEFAHSVAALPMHFASGEHIGTIPVSFKIYLESSEISLASCPELLISCDASSIQTFVDNIISNAVR